ncbi:DNA/RNA nuclease SfsA [Ornithinibacillus sp. FSL M8-0202]|uniref:DNA/RNA nuclease SfsA n=1 Tax=unclassified Ornithinibacillus TaxID=2620869 RepID=UPI0030CE6B07
MRYGTVITGVLHRKVNRFIAEVIIDGVMEHVHIKNTGRLKELLVPGAEVVMELSTNPNRKTKFSLIAVWKNGRLVNIDSQAPNRVVLEAIREGRMKELGKVGVLKREVSYGDSRFDFYYEKGSEKGFIEVKGVTLEEQGIAMFPDAPTVRGTKHVLELIKAKEEGYQATIIFVIQMKGCNRLIPHSKMDEAFANALVSAAECGVQVLAYDTVVKENELTIDQAVLVSL